MSNIILHIPHSSINIPSNIRLQFCLSDPDLDSEILKMTDHYTNELFDIESADKIIFPVSRLVLDPERFADDNLEPMSKIGMGVVYNQTSDLKSLRHNITKEDKELLINTYYHPHHEKLNKACKNFLNNGKECLIIDCHSFPSKSLPYELKANGNLKRPEICIGTDSFHTSKQLENKIYKLFKDLGYDVSINEPFAGSLVPMEYYNKNNRVQSLMIEVRRDLYMNELTGEKSSNFNKVKKDLNLILSSL